MKNRKYATFKDGKLTTPQPEPPQPKPKRTMTHLEFMRRLTDAELAQIYGAARQSPALEVWLEKFKMAKEISLDDPEIVQGIHVLEQMGLLAEGRAVEVLG